MKNSPNYRDPSNAFADGRRAGLCDAQWCRHVYSDAWAYMDWARGHREGQAGFLGGLAASAGITLEQAKKMDRRVLWGMAEQGMRRAA